MSSGDTQPHDYEGTSNGGREKICAFGLKYNSDLNRCDGNFVLSILFQRAPRHHSSMLPKGFMINTNMYIYFSL